MRIVQVCAEFSPVAKAGGMGEALLGLTRELVKTHGSVEVFFPKYSWIEGKDLKDLKLEISDFRCKEKGHSVSNSIWSAEVEECPVRMVEVHHPSGYFHRKKIYGYEDDAARFLYFCKVVIEYLKEKGEPIDILHLHDWHTAPCAFLARDRLLKVGAVLLTVHNFEYQGRCAPWDLEAVGIDPAGCFEDFRYPETSNLLKGGILHADAVTTVSPTYARESLAPQGAYGLSSYLKKKKFVGILNGICMKSWNPSEDARLVANYHHDQSSQKISSQKEENKKELQRAHGLDCIGQPLFGVVTRLMPNKGTDLIEEVIDTILAQNGALALIGYAPMKEIQEQFDGLKERFKDNPRIFLCYEYNDVTARRIYAACDFLLVPSLTEPCGLTQLIALRYGAIPIVHSTGGLKDTVFDFEDVTAAPQKRNGIVFNAPTKEVFDSAIKRAAALWYGQASLFQLTQKRAMQGDYSWKTGAQEYLKLYRKLL